MGTAIGYILVGYLSDILGRRWTMIVFNIFGLIGGNLPFKFTNKEYFGLLCPGTVACTASTLETLAGANVSRLKHLFCGIIENCV
jgi:MFS family permease